MNNLAHLHVHGGNSLMDGLNFPEELVAHAQALGHKSIALTDHGTLSGHRALQEACAKADMKPILGLEAYISPTDRFDKRSIKKRDDNTQLYNHLIILAKNQTGVVNLNAMSREAWQSGFYSKPRIDKELLEQHGEGLIILSGCMNGLIAKAIEREQMDEANSIAAWFKRVFGDDFYMEVQPHNPPELNHALLKLADEHGIKPVATADAHFAKESDRHIEELMLVLSTNPKEDKTADFQASRKMEIWERLNYLYPDRPISFQHIDVFLQDRQRMEDGFDFQGIHRRDLYENTLEIADKVEEYQYHKGLDLLPSPKNDDPDNVLMKMAWEGLEALGLDKNPDYIVRMREELDIILAKKFSTYFLIVWMMIKFARENDVYVGPGRGSSAGSLLCYALGITSVDPIEHGLLFFRFIDPSRDDWPDIDTDIEARGRRKVINYLSQQFEHVAAIATFMKWSDKNVLKDAARAYRIPIEEINLALKGSEKFDEFFGSSASEDFRKKYPEVSELAKALHGRIKTTGMHAAAVVISKEPIENYAPIETRAVPNDKAAGRIPVVALDMEQVADIGMIKIDALGLKTLTVIHDTIDSINSRHGLNLNYLEIPLDDANVYQDLTNGHTKGVFQAEAPPYTNLLIRMGVDNFAELAASNALVRPGAMNTIGKTYVARKKGLQQVEYLHPILEPFTKDTYGCILYQEQVMLACVELGGMTMGEANKVRKIIGKKRDVREFDAYRDQFVEGASKHVTTEQAEALWHDFEAHAGYSFNKSHAVAYSMLTYWTAWLKHYYPLEFMYAALRNEGDKDKLTEYLIESKRIGLSMQLPHVNNSELDFSLSTDSIVFGLTAIKYVSDNVGGKLMSLRPFANYAELYDASRVVGSGINSRTIQALNAVGAASFPDNPRTGQEPNNYYEYLGVPRFDYSMITPEMRLQVTTFDEYSEKGSYFVIGMAKTVKRGTGWARVEFIDETGGAGIFTTENTTITPGTMYLMLVSDNSIMRHIPLEDLKQYPDDVMLRLLSRPAPLRIDRDRYIVVSFKTRRTRAGKPMATAVIANQDKEMKKVMVFPGPVFHKAFGRMKEGAVVKLSLARTEDDTLFIKEIYDEIIERPTIGA